jgi:hypothetical protein
MDRDTVRSVIFSIVDSHRVFAKRHDWLIQVDEVISHGSFLQANFTILFAWSIEELHYSGDITEKGIHSWLDRLLAPNISAKTYEFAFELSWGGGNNNV